MIDKFSLRQKKVIIGTLHAVFLNKTKVPLTETKTITIRFICTPLDWFRDTAIIQDDSASDQRFHDGLHQKASQATSGPRVTGWTDLV